MSVVYIILILQDYRQEKMMNQAANGSYFT